VASDWHPARAQRGGRSTPLRVWLTLVVAAGFLAGCGSNGHSSGPKFALHYSSNCKQWNAANLSEKLGYVSNIEGGGAVVPGAAPGLEETAAIKEELSSRCNQAAQDGLDASTKIAAIVPMHPASPSSVTSTSPTEEPGGPLSVVGTIRQSDGEGTAIRSSYELGPLIYSKTATPPAAVLEACGADYQTTIAQMAFARGKVTVNYTEGSLAQNIGFLPEGSVRSTSRQAPWQGTVAYDIEGQWRCNGTGEESGDVTFQPGESKTVPFWILAQVLSNAAPQVTPEAMDAWRFMPSGISTESVHAVVTTSGRGAGRCEAEDVLMLYAELPFSVEADNGTGNMVGCRALR
jgi:hypothetical protein